MNVKELEYKRYRIEIHPQKKTGDNTKVYFGIWRGNHKIFGLWEQLSGTEARKISQEKAYDFLEKKGLERVKTMIDSVSFEEGKEIKVWEALR